QYSESGLRLSADGTSAFFSRALGPRDDAGDLGYDLYTASRASNGSFGQIRMLAPPSLVGSPDDRNPAVANGGGTILFESDRIGYGIWMATRAFLTSDFNQPGPVTFWGDGAEFQPYVTPDGNALYFTSWHAFAPNAPATHNLWRADLSHGLVGDLTIVDV